MHLTRQQRVFGNVGASGVLVEREEEEPDHAHENQEAREVRGELVDGARVAAQFVDEVSYPGSRQRLA